MKTYSTPSRLFQPRIISLVRNGLVTFLLLFCCFSQTAFAVQYWWRFSAPDNVWTNGNNWSTGGFFGAAAGTSPGAADIATFGLDATGFPPFGETPNNITFTGVPVITVGAIYAQTLQRTLTFPAGVTLIIAGAGTGSDAGGNANIIIAPGATMRVLAGATVQGAGNGHRWQINGTLELVDNGAVISSGMGFAPGSTLLYSGTGAKTAGSEFIDGNTNLPYATGFPGNIIVNKATGVLLDMTTPIAIQGSTTLLAGTMRNGSAGNLTFNGSFLMSGANCRLTSGCAGGTITLNNAVNSMSGAGTEIWLGSGTFTVNGGATLNITNGRLNLVGTGGGCGTSGQITGGGSIVYTTPGGLGTIGNWVGTIDTPELPISPTAMNGVLDLVGAGGPVTIANDLRLLGDLNLSATAGRHMVMAMNRELILEGAGTINAPGAVSRIQVNNVNTVRMRRAGFNSVHYIGNYIFNLVIDNAANVSMTNPLTVDRLNFQMPGNLVVGPTTLTLQGNGTNLVTGGVGRVDASAAGSIVELTGNPLIDGARFVAPIQTLRTGVAPAAAPSLNAGTFAVNNLDHANGSLTITVPLTLNAGGTHTIATGAPTRTLNVASFGRLVLPDMVTLTNNGILNVQSAGTLEIQGSGNVTGTNVAYDPTGARGTLEYTGNLNSTTPLATFPNPMPGNVITNKTGGTVRLTGNRDVQGNFNMQDGVFDLDNVAQTLTLSGSYARTTGLFRSTTQNPSLTLNCDATSGGGIVFQAAPNNQLNALTANSTTVRMGSNLLANNVQVPSGTLDVFTTTLEVNGGTASLIGPATLNVANTGRFRLTAPANLTNNGAVTINGGATLEIQNNPTFTGNTPTYTGTTSILHYTGGIAARNPTSAEFPNTMPGSVIIANTIQVLQQPTPTTKTVAGNFTFLGGGPLLYSLAGVGNTLIINGTLTNTAGSDFQAVGDNLTLNGPVVNPIRFVSAVMKDVTFGAGSGNVILGTPLNINAAGTLTMNGGNITTTAVNLLTVNNTAPTAIVRTSGFVDGPLIRAINAAGTYLYPVGAGGAYLPFGVQNAGAAATIQVQAFNGGSGGVAGSGMTAGSLSTTEYWQTNLTAGAWTGGQVTAGRVANFPANSTLGRYDGATPAGQLFSAIGPLGFVAANTITSTNFPVVAPAATMFFATGLQVSATELRYFQQPTNVQQGNLIAPAVTIAATDAAGNVDNTYSGTVTITAPNLVGSPINAAFVNGVAILSSLKFSATGTFNLTATGVLPFVPAGNSVSTAFTVTAAPVVINGAALPAAPAGYAGMPFNAVNMSGLGRTLNITNVAISGAGVPIVQANCRFVQPGAALTINFDVGMSNIALPPCPGCITAFYMGLSGGNNGTVTGATPGNIPPVAFNAIIAGNGTVAPTPRTYTFNAPTAPGIYYISITPGWDFFNSSPRQYSFGSNAGSSIGYIVVGACSQSDIVEDPGFVPNFVTRIPYVNFTGGAVSPASPDVWLLRLRDGAGAADADGVNTRLTSLQLQVNDPRGVIQNLELFDNLNNSISGSVTPVAGFANFTGLTIDALQGVVAGTQIRVKASYRTSPSVAMQIMDGAPITFQVTGAGTAAIGSQLANPAAVVGPNPISNLINVTADRFNVITQPILTIVTGATMRASPVVRAEDTNTNLDVDYVGTVTAANPKLTPASPSTTTAVLGVATFPNITLLGSSSATETLSFDDIGPFPAVNSNTFALIQPRVWFTPTTFFNIGGVAIGTIKDTVITVNGANVIANGSAYFQRLAPGMTFSFPAQPLQITPLTLTPSPAPTPSDMQGVGYSQQIRIRYQPTATNIDTAVIRATFGQSSVPIAIFGRGVNPDPYTLSFTRRPFIYDSSGVANRAVQSGSVIDSIFVSTFRQDSVWIPVTGTRVITLTPVPVAGSTGTFSINNMVSISVPITNTTIATFSNVTVRWTNAPITASTTPVLLRATINDPTILSTTISLTLNVGNTQPRITSFSPKFAAPGQQVTITGTDFFSIQTVRFNGRAATFTTPSSTQIIATVPSGIVADTGMVFVSNGVFADSLSTFEVARPPQIREYFAISNGARRGYEENVQAENKPLRIRGQYLRPRFNTSEAYSGTSVRLGGVPTAFVNVLNDSTADAIVGAGATGTLEYQNPAGTTTASVGFEFLPPPEIHGITPLFAGLNAEITVTGANFRVLDTLRLGALVIPNNRLTIDNGFSRLRFRITDTVSSAISLVTAAGSTTSSQSFTFVPPPEILMVSPDTGTFGTAITLTGRNFIQVTTVTVGSRPPFVVSRISSTQLIIVAGAGLTGQAPITLATPGGSTSSSIQFTFINIPQVLRFSPQRGGPGTEVIITGANFTNIQKVTFGDLPAKSFIVRSTSEIVAIVDDNGASGRVNVLNSAGQGFGQDQFNFYFTPRVGSITPFSGATGSTVVITGSQFVEVSTVTIGGVAVADFVVETPERIVAIVATGATGRVAVTNPGGTGTSVNTFRFVEPERPPAPFITNFSPDTAYVGDILRVEGLNFINVRRVRINGVTVSTYSVDSPNAITLVVPVTSTGTVEITSTTGTGTSKKIFVYAPPPKPLTLREQDSITAVQIYNTTSGQEWARQLGWLTTLPLESWQGVTVEGGRITRLSLDSAGLRGELPAFISRLTALKYISMRVNELQGSFPQNLTLLPNLEEVLLSNNQFTGQLPTGIGKMANLRVLRLDGNRFTGGIPAELCELTKAQEISLAQNRLTGRISACLSRIVTLQRLDLSQNQFTGGIPSEFANLVNVRELRISNNTLNEALPTNIWGSASNLASTEKNNASIQAGGMTALTQLEVSNNKIPGTIPAELANAKNIESLLLNGNELTGEIPRTLGGLKALRTLDLSRNQLSGQIPTGLTEARALERLTLTKNTLSGRIPAELSNLINLRSLSLDSNTFSGAVPDALTQLARLQLLRLDSNKLTSIPNLRSLSALTVLNVANNQLMFETIDPNIRTSDVAFTYTFAPQDTVRLLKDTSAAVGFRFIVSLPIVNENNIYQWFKNGRAIPNTNNSSLSFAMFTRLDTGLFMCQITNKIARGLTLTTRPIRISSATATLPNAAPFLVSPANGVGNIELTTTFQWEAVAGAGAYDIQIATDSAFTQLVADETTNNTQFRPANTALRNFITYRWRVRARNEAGAGVWSEVRFFTTIQEGAILVIPDADLGRSIVGRQRVGTVNIQNLLTSPVSIESARIGGRDATSFGIRTNLANVVLQAGQVLPVEIIFTPQSIGAKQAELLINVSSGGASSVQRGIVRGTASLLDVNDVQFDTLLVGFAKIRNAAVLNLGNAATRINAIRIADEDIFQLDLPTPPPYTIARGDTLILPIRCYSTRVGKAKTTITVITDAGDSLVVNAEGNVRERRESDVQATFGLRALDSNVAPGGRVRIKLFIYDNKTGHGATVNRVDNLATYRAEIRFNRNVLVAAPDEKNMFAIGNDDFQRYSIPLTTWFLPQRDSNEIAVFNCVAVSGNIDTTPLIISDLTWGDNNKLFVSFAVTTGTFTTNLCKAGGLRLTTTAKKNAIAQIRPNPAKDEANIVYSVREDGAVELSLFDVQGRLVQTLVRGDHTPGEYSLSMPTTQLPSGSYFLVMLTPSGKVQERLQVVR